MRKPRAVSDCALSVEDTHALLKRVDLPSRLVDAICDLLARPLPRASAWSRARGVAPGRRVDLFELFAGLALTCCGTRKESLSLLFSLFDISGEGVLGRDDIGALVSTCASVLCRLGLSLHLTVDESAYLAGEAFLGNSQGCSEGSGGTEYGNENDELGREELNFPMFLRWAQRAEFPIRAFEVLALPHHFSRVVEQALAMIELLRTRYAVDVRGLEFRRKKQAHPNAIDQTLGLAPGYKGNSGTFDNHSLDIELVLMKLQEHGNSRGVLPLSLAPTLSSISSHAVCIALEVGRGETTVAIVEARQGSRFSLVDAQTLHLEEGRPIVIKLSRLRPATDHRFQLVHGAQLETIQGGDDFAHGRHDAIHVCATIRFRTLPACFRIIGYRTAISAIPTGKEMDEQGPKRRQIEILDAGFQNDVDDESFGALSVSETAVMNNQKVDFNQSKDEGGVAVMIWHQHTTSLEVPEARSVHNDGGESWWFPATHVNGPSNHLSVFTWPLETESPQSLTSSSLSIAAKFTTSMTPFAGEGVSRAAATVMEEDLWSNGVGRRSGSIDLVLHLHPNWHAPEAVRRCFTILKSLSGNRMTVPTQDATVRVLREATVAVRALLSKACGLQRYKPGIRNEAAREGAHVIIGRIDPWLGLDTVRGCL